MRAPSKAKARPDAHFCARYESGAAQILSRTLVDDLITPVAAMLRLGPQTPDIFLMESVQGGDWRGRYSMIGLEPDARFMVHGGKAQISLESGAWKTREEAPLAALRRFVEEARLDMPEGLPPMAAGVFGYLGYDMVRQVEHLPDGKTDPLALPQALLLRPSLVAVFDSVAQEIILATPVRPGAGVSAEAAFEAATGRLQALQARLFSQKSLPPVQQGDPPSSARPPNPQSNINPAAYRAMVERARAYIRAGDIFQMVPSQCFSAPLPASPFALYRSLRRLNPSPFLYYLNFDDFAVAGSSPEILVRLRACTMTIRPIAGTRPRGQNPAEDTALRAELLADPKERAEHLMLLDLGRNDVARVCKPGTVQVTQQFAVEPYSHVMHIVSNVQGQLEDGQDAIDALFAGFPAGTVSGAPKIRAMQIIDELETRGRGLYAGAIGYFSAGGDMDTCIALRTAVIKDGVMHVQAGGGVVLDSDPEAERMETVQKASALFSAAEQSWRFAENPSGSKPG